MPRHGLVPALDATAPAPSTLSPVRDPVCLLDHACRSAGPAERAETLDAFVTGTHVPHEHADNTVEIERPHFHHLLEVGPISCSIEEGLEDRQIIATKEGNLYAREFLKADTGGNFLMKFGGVEKNVDGCPVPPQPNLAIRLRPLDISIRPHHTGGQRRKDLESSIDVGEDVQINVDRASGTLCTPRESQRTTECVGDSRFV
jgi:hypothetical protein